MAVIVVDKNLLQGKKAEDLPAFLGPADRFGVTDALLYEVGTDSRGQQITLLRRLGAIKERVTILRHPPEVIREHGAASIFPDHLYYPTERHEQLREMLTWPQDEQLAYLRKVLPDMVQQRAGVDPRTASAALSAGVDARISASVVHDPQDPPDLLGSEGRFVELDDTLRAQMMSAIDSGAGMDYRGKAFQKVLPHLRETLLHGPLCSQMFDLSWRKHLPTSDFKDLPSNSLVRLETQVHVAGLLVQFYRFGDTQLGNEHQETRNFYHDLGYAVLAIGCHGKLATQDDALRKAAMVLDLDLVPA